MSTPTKLFEFIHHQREHYPQEKCLVHKQGGRWVSYSSEEAVELAMKLSVGLLQLGVKPGDKIAVIVEENRPEWVILDTAIQQIGAVNVPVYPTISASENSYIFNESEVSYCFVESEALFRKVDPMQKEVPSLKKIYTFDQVEGATNWKELVVDGGIGEVNARMEKVNGEDLATIIYTSGTTGEPKGVMLSHRNIISAVTAVLDDVALDPGDRTLSFLPLCHIFERTGNYFQIYRGCNIYFAGTGNLGGPDGDLMAVKPHFFNTVPRLLEKIYEHICNAGAHLEGEAKKLFDMAMSLTETYEFDLVIPDKLKPKWALVEKHIFSKWRMALGGSLRGAISGASPLPRRIAQFYRSMGINLREGYGLTETSPGLSLTKDGVGAALLGTVGPAVNGVELRIDETAGDYEEGEGEIIASGPNVMLGYYKKPEKTREVLEEIDGKIWFRTGDVGRFVNAPNGMPLLKITDRKKELLKTSGGKYVAPAPIENELTQSFFIENAMVVGDQRKFVTALILPAQESLRYWCEQHQIVAATLDEMIARPEVIAHYQEIVDAVNEDLSKIEKIKKFTLISGLWSPFQLNGTPAELTPTLKLKRRIIREKYRKVIDSMYVD